MNVRGERIIIFGDSLSHPGLDNAPTLQDITRGSDRPSSAPGDLLGSILLEQGAQAVRTNAKVGRSAISFLGNEPAATLLSTDQAFRPTKVIVMLGTNDAERDLARTEIAMKQIRDAYRAMGAEVWAIGPMTYAGRGSSLNEPASKIFEAMQRVFGGVKTIDGRPLSMGAQHAGDGIHFTQAGAKTVAAQLASALLIAAPLRAFRPFVGVAIGFGVIFGLGLLASWLIRRRNSSAPRLLGAGDDWDEDLDWDAPSWERRIDEKRKRRVAEVEAALKKSPALIANDGRNDWLLITSGEMHESERGKFRVTTFADDGPMGHEVKPTMADVVREIATGHGYKSVRPASDDDVIAWTSTPKFIEGSKRVAFTQAANTLSFRAGAKGRHSEAREIEMRAHKLASEDKWDDAVLLLQEGIKELGGQTPGGKARGRSPSSFNQKDLETGMRVEFEHTSDPEIARKIAMDHLTEDPDYYRKLKAIHLDGARTSLSAWLPRA